MIDPALRLVVNVWPALPEEVKREVLSIIRAAAVGSSRPAQTPSDTGEVT